MKLSVNCFVIMKISFVNMIGDIVDVMFGVDKFDIFRVVGQDICVGYWCIFLGYGFGGFCFLRDNRVFGMYVCKVGIIFLICDVMDEYN